MINVTQDQLFTLFTNSELIPGKKYRIVDYKPVVSHNYAKWNEQQYDLVVIAISNN